MKPSDNLDICAICGCSFQVGEECWNCFHTDNLENYVSLHGTDAAFFLWVRSQNGNIPENNNQDYYETWKAGAQWAISMLNGGKDNDKR